jgi:hypothetical protein
MADEALKNMSERFDGMYAKTRRPSIPPEKLLRAQLIQMLYSIRSERLLMEDTTPGRPPFSPLLQSDRRTSERRFRLGPRRLRRTTSVAASSDS